MKMKMLSKAKIFEGHVKNEWTKMFTLLPVRINEDQIAWLEHVERRVEQYWRNDNRKYKWVYREIMCPRAREALEAAQRAALMAQRREEQAMWAGPEDWDAIAQPGPMVAPGWGMPQAEPQVEEEPA